MRITLLRHAEVIEEYQGKYNGHIDIPLSKKGIKQAQELAIELKSKNFDKVYCSDLIRARQTLTELNLEIEPIYSSKLREKSWGRHEGKSFSEIQDEGIEYKNFEQWLSSLDGEDIESYTNKIKEYFFETVFKQSSQNILVLTHSGAIKTLIKIIKNISIDEAFSIELPYASYIVLNDINTQKIE